MNLAKARPSHGVGAMITVALSVVVAASLAATGCFDSGSGSGHDAGAAVRVNQVGYPTGSTKIAYLLAGSGAAKTRFDVVDDAGHVRGSGTVGPTRGGWNSGYGAVFPIDLSAVDAPGVYQIRLIGADHATSPRFRITTATELYAPLVAKVTRFFQAQRDGAGVVPAVLRRKASHAADASASVYDVPTFDGDNVSGSLDRVDGDPIDVSGGWFDAGDYLKFTATTSYALVNLLLASRSGNQSPALGGEIDFGLSWLEKMWDDKNGILYAQVGIGSVDDKVLGDHDVWRLPQADDALDAARGSEKYFLKYRPVFPANPDGARLSPNLAGRVAAAFAMAAQAHVSTDPARARGELARAASVYSIADTGSPRKLVSVYPHSFYPEESWRDDLELGAVELALAGHALGDRRTGDWAAQASSWASTSRDDASHDDAQAPLDIYDVSALAHLDLAVLAQQAPALGVDAKAALADVAVRLTAAQARSERDPFRADATYDDVSARLLGLVTLALRYAQVTADRRLADFAMVQAGWVLGANAWGTSLVVGVGSTFPHCPHHQIANLSGSLDGTGDVLEGAVVNGPAGVDPDNDPGQFTALPGARACSAGSQTFRRFNGQDAQYVDAVGHWDTVEPAIDMASEGALAFALLAQG